MVSRDPTKFSSPLIPTDRVFKSIKIALKNKNFDIAYISLPNHMHFEVANILLDANINLIIDKPAVLNRSEFDCLLSKAKKNNLFISESLVYQYHPGWQSFKSFYRDKTTPGLLQAQFTIPQLPADNFRNNIIMGGGVINDMGPYMIDVCTRFFEEMPKNINSNIRNGINHLDPIFISAQFGQNIFFNGIFGFNLPYQNQVKFFSDNLVVSLERVFSPPSDYEAVILKQSDGRSTEITVGAADVFELYFQRIFELYLTKNFSTILSEFEVQCDRFLKIKEAKFDEKF